MWSFYSFSCQMVRGMSCNSCTSRLEPSEPWKHVFSTSCPTTTITYQCMPSQAWSNMIHVCHIRHSLTYCLSYWKRETHLHFVMCCFVLKDMMMAIFVILHLVLIFLTYLKKECVIVNLMKSFQRGTKGIKAECLWM